MRCSRRPPRLPPGRSPGRRAGASSASGMPQFGRIPVAGPSPAGPRYAARLVFAWAPRMAATDPADEIPELSSKLDSIEAVVDPEAMRTEAADLREQSADPGLWEDQARAQQVGRRLSYLEGELARMENLRQRLDDTRVMFELADEE